MPICRSSSVGCGRNCLERGTPNCTCIGRRQKDFPNGRRARLRSTRLVRGRSKTTLSSKMRPQNRHPPRPAAPGSAWGSRRYASVRTSPWLDVIWQDASVRPKWTGWGERYRGHSMGPRRFLQVQLSGIPRANASSQASQPGSFDPGCAWRYRLNPSRASDDNGRFFGRAWPRELPNAPI